MYLQSSILLFGNLSCPSRSCDGKYLYIVIFADDHVLLVKDNVKDMTLKAQDT